VKLSFSCYSRPLARNTALERRTLSVVLKEPALPRAKRTSAVEGVVGVVWSIRIPPPTALGEGRSVFRRAPRCTV